ncbi:MAG: LysM peptidoglycan-binding domain-containing protein [Brevefilum sp.]
MKNTRTLVQSLTIILTGFVLFLGALNVEARSLSQASYQTATPNNDGQIFYTVQEGDSCTRIFLLTGVPIDQIIELNDLTSECLLTPGQQLVIATVEPATPTPEGPAPTPTPGPPTPTPFEGNAEVCVVLFEDLDGNQMRAESEFYLEDGVVSINNRAGTFSETIETVGGDPAIVEPVCFENVPEGDYNLSMGIPNGYVATTSLNLPLEVTAGDTIVIDFGAQPSSQPPEPVGPIQRAGRSPLLLVIGILFLAGGAVLTFFFIRSRIRS